MSGDETPARVYPLPAPEDDARFSVGLLIEVAALLESHGYPPVRHGLDLVDLQQALFRFLYSTTSPTSPPPRPDQEA